MTGLATVALGREERYALAALSSPAEVEHVYMSRFLPCKLKIERHYRNTWSLGMDAWILLQTGRVILSPQTLKMDIDDPICVGNEAGLRRAGATIKTPHL